MAKAIKEIKTIRLVNDKGTSQGLSNLKMSSMNKHKKRSFKKYRGQGKV
jgi:hypothetical protein